MAGKNFSQTRDTRLNSASSRESGNLLLRRSRSVSASVVKLSRFGYTRSRPDEDRASVPEGTRISEIWPRRILTWVRRKSASMIVHARIIEGVGSKTATGHLVGGRL